MAIPQSVSTESNRFWLEGNQMLKPQRTRKFGKVKDNEQIQEFRPLKQGRKQIVELNVQFYNRLYFFCQTLGTKLLREFRQ